MAEERGSGVGPLAEPPDSTTELPTATPPRKGHPPQFWIIIASLSLLAFISALDTMIITTAMPTIIEDVGGASEYVWIANSFVFASSVLQPLIGQLADILGRKSPMLVSISLFIIGSGIAGGANDAAMLISGRAVQGLGAGGIYVLMDIVCSDLVPLRDRAKYLAIINAWAGVAAALGPVVGGLLAASNWRWIFYMNIPICAVPLVTILFFMRVKTGDGSYKLKELDYLGSLIFIPSIIAVLWGLVTGGVTYPWSSWRVIFPLVIGIVGWICFHLQQHFFAKYPSVPTRLFSNRTSAASFALTFLSSALLQAAGYFLPVYFQAVLRASVSDSGVWFLPIAIGSLLFAVVAGILLSKFGAYRPIHAGSFAITVVGYGLFTLLDENTRTVAWVFFQIILVAGLGPSFAVILPAILAALPQSDVAAATAVFSFLKTFGFVWGVTVPSVIFNGVFNANLYRISSSELRDQLSDGKAYAFASEANKFSKSVDPKLWKEITDVYVVSLRSIWWFGLGLSIISLAVVGFERSLELSTQLDTEYGLEEREDGLQEKKDGTNKVEASTETAPVGTPPV